MMTMINAEMRGVSQSVLIWKNYFERVQFEPYRELKHEEWREVFSKRCSDRSDEMSRWKFGW